MSGRKNKKDAGREVKMKHLQDKKNSLPLLGRLEQLRAVPQDGLAGALA